MEVTPETYTNDIVPISFLRSQIFSHILIAILIEHSMKIFLSLSLTSQTSMI